MTTQDAPSGAASGPRLARYNTAFLLVGVPVALFLIILFLLCRNVWFSTNSVLGYQAFIPLGALALVWDRRFEIRKIMTELAILFPDPEHPKRRGNEWMAVVGAIIVLLGVLASTPLIGLFGFLVMVAGVVFCIYGPFVLRGLAGPISYLALTFIPPPVLSLIGPVSGEVHFRSVAFTGYILKGLRREPHIQGTTLTLNGQPPLDVPASFSGMELRAEERWRLQCWFLSGIG
ncbi:MAG: archaeosortase/exosortase family protein [Armatimonas sp.]